jgi:hypothetical protein
MLLALPQEILRPIVDDDVVSNPGAREEKFVAGHDRFNVDAEKLGIALAMDADYKRTTDSIHEAHQPAICKYQTYSQATLSRLTHSHANKYIPADQA